jgi:hypothetical protein
VGNSIFNSIPNSQTVTVRIPESAKAGYGVPGLPDTPYDNSNTSADNWGNAFRGRGWDGTNYGSGYWPNGSILLVFETYTP